MKTLLVGFDSAWTANNSGGLVGTYLDGGTFHDLGLPQVADFPRAQEIILRWQHDLQPATTIVLLDQPTIVKNKKRQRPVENIVGSSVSRRRGGMQPANTSKTGMFDEGAPVWEFLALFGGAADPLRPAAGTRVFETYPVLSMIALGWLLPDSRPANRLPKYNPLNRNFSNTDWQFVCKQAAQEFRQRGLFEMVKWIDSVPKTAPRKCDQDKLDACLCLLVALDLAERKDCLMVGDLRTGYIVAPYAAGLRAELDARCRETNREPSEWVRVFGLDGECHATEVAPTTLPESVRIGDFNVAGHELKATMSVMLRGRVEKLTLFVQPNGRNIDVEVYEPVLDSMSLQIVAEQVAAVLDNEAGRALLQRAAAGQKRKRRKGTQVRVRLHGLEDSSNG